MGRSPAKIRIIGYEPNPDETTRVLRLRLTYKRPAADHVLKALNIVKMTGFGLKGHTAN